MRPICFIAVFALLFITACGTRGPAALFKKTTPREQYSEALQKSGLAQTALAKRWMAAGDASLQHPVSATLPYRETGYFDGAEPRAAAFRFPVKRGQQLEINLSKTAADSTLVFLELRPDGQPADARPLAFADTLNNPISYAVEEDGFCILRLQPELLRDLQYTLSINTGPSLGFPVLKGSKSRIGSFYGVDRDGGSRRHEGVDIFAPFRTPAVAASAGRVVRVNENNLGGLTVWMRPEGKAYTLYYAHLDRQIAVEGQEVLPGDTLGLIGNTGNARTTPPHLHFGVYGSGGAVDPFPFINPLRNKPAAVTASPAWLNGIARIGKNRLVLRELRTNQALNLYRYDQVQILAAERNLYRASLPDGRQVLVPASAIEKTARFRTADFTTEKFLLNRPAEDALRKRRIPAATKVDVLAAYQDYYYIKIAGETGWIKKT